MSATMSAGPWAEKHFRFPAANVGRVRPVEGRDFLLRVHTLQEILRIRSWRKGSGPGQSQRGSRIAEVVAFPTASSDAPPIGRLPLPVSGEQGGSVSGQGHVAAVFTTSKVLTATAHVDGVGSLDRIAGLVHFDTAIMGSFRGGLDIPAAAEAGSAHVGLGLTCRPRMP
jgi:hypothetical protein